MNKNLELEQFGEWSETWNNFNINLIKSYNEYSNPFDASECDHSAINPVSHDSVFYFWPENWYDLKNIWCPIQECCKNKLEIPNKEFLKKRECNDGSESKILIFDIIT